MLLVFTGMYSELVCANIRLKPIINFLVSVYSDLLGINNRFKEFFVCSIRFLPLASGTRHFQMNHRISWRIYVSWFPGKTISINQCSTKQVQSGYSGTGKGPDQDLPELLRPRQVHLRHKQYQPGLNRRGICQAGNARGFSQELKHTCRGPESGFAWEIPT